MLFRGGAKRFGEGGKRGFAPGEHGAQRLDGRAQFRQPGMEGLKLLLLAGALVFKLEAGTVIDIPVEREDQRRESDKAFSEPESVSSPAAKEPTVIEKEVKPQPAEGKGAASVVSEAAQAKNYTIKKNDSLWKIAKEQLGDGNRWREIYELNKDVIKNPYRLKAGKIILLPQ